jgi:hypothetical protein
LTDPATVSRRAPAWAVEVVAWSAALVLLAGVGVVATDGIRTSASRLAAQAGEVPVVALGPGEPPAQPPARGTVVTRQRLQLSLPKEPALGPPPGPQADVAPTLVAPPEKRFALLVGVTDYRSPTHDTLAGARDVAFINSYLLANGWRSQNIKVLADGRATGAAVREGLSWLAARSTPGTFTLFHYSGHVKQSGGHEQLWGSDNVKIPDTTVAATLRLGSGKMWVDIAGCEAGGFIENLPSARVLVTASSKVTQKSYEHPRWGESVWVGLMWDAGLAQGQADLNHDGVTTVGEAIRYAAYWAQAVTLRQRPNGRQSPQAAGDPVRGWTVANPPA